MTTTPRQGSSRPWRCSRKRRSAFSLIELLIVVAIIACLIGTVGGIYTDFTTRSMQTKARLDIDIFVNALNRYRHQEGPFGGLSFKPLHGRFLQTIPVDPWANNYVVDAGLCVLGSFGGDGVPLGELNDEDILRQYNQSLCVISAEYTGSSLPKTGDSLRIYTSKPFYYLKPADVIGSVDVAEEINLIKQNGDTFALAALGFVLDGTSNARKGEIALVCQTPPSIANADLLRRIRAGDPSVLAGPITMDDIRLPIRIVIGDRINFAPLMLSITDGASAGSPLLEVEDNFRFGPVSLDEGVPISF